MIFIMCVYCGALFRIVNFTVVWTLIYFYESLLVSITHVIGVGDIYKIIESF